MHGPAYQGDCTKALLELADGYAQMLADRVPDRPTLRRTPMQTLDHDSVTIHIDGSRRSGLRARRRRHPHARVQPRDPARAHGSTARPDPPSAHVSPRATRSRTGRRGRTSPSSPSSSPAQKFAFARTEKFAGTVEWTYEFEPDGDGTLVTESYRVTRPLSPIGWFIIGVVFARADRRTDLRTGMEQTLRRLRDAAEHAPKSSTTPSATP